MSRRLRLAYREIIEILEAYGFTRTDQNKPGSHRAYVGLVHGREQHVTVAPHGELSAICPPGTLNSIIRQSGLGKKIFRRWKSG